MKGHLCGDHYCSSPTLSGFLPASLMVVGRLLPLCSSLRLSIACDLLWPVKCAALLERSFQSWFTIWHFMLFCLSQWSLCQAGPLSASARQKPLPVNPSWVQSLSTRYTWELEVACVTMSSRISPVYLPASALYVFRVVNKVECHTEK